MKNNSKLSVGVLGLGWMGSTRARILAELPSADLVMCCDANPAAEARVPDGSRFTTDFNDLLAADLDALIVSTPDGLHRDPTVRALQAGLDVFCEKPLATTLEDADAMIQAEQTSASRIVVGHTLRADPRYRALQMKVASGELGRAVHTTSRRSWPAPEGERQAGQTTLARYLSVHELDALQWVVGHPITSVYAEASATELPGFKGEAASLVATLRFADGSVATHECSWGLPDQAGMVLGDCALSFVGTEGAAYLHQRDHGVVVYGGARGIEQPSSTMDDLFQVRGAVEFPAADVAMLGALGTPYAAELAEFVRCCTTGDEPLVSSEEARSALAAVIALETSLATGQPCSVSSSLPTGVTP